MLRKLCRLARPLRNSAAENGLTPNYTVLKCHSHVVFYFFGVNKVSMCLYALDRCCFFWSECKGNPAKTPGARAGPASPPHPPTEKPRLHPFGVQCPGPELTAARPLGARRGRGLYLDEDVK